MKHSGTTSVRIRNEDVEFAKRETQRLPVSTVNLLSAWRHCWESATFEAQIEALRKVRSVRRGRPPKSRCVA